MSKKAKGEKNFFMKHKVLTIIGALVIVGAIVGANGESTSTNSSNTANVIEEHSEITKEEKAINVDNNLPFNGFFMDFIERYGGRGESPNLLKIREMCSEIYKFISRSV